MAAASTANAAWLEDVVVHLLCVLALDRFADYVSDQVSAETEAELLEMCLLKKSLLPQSWMAVMVDSDGRQ